MNPEISNDKELHELPNGLQPENLTEDEEQNIGDYGRMAPDHMHNTDPHWLSLFMMRGRILHLMYRMDTEATEQIKKMIQNFLLKDPTSETEDVTEEIQRYNQYKLMIEEIVILTIVQWAEEIAIREISADTETSKMQREPQGSFCLLDSWI